MAKMFYYYAYLFYFVLQRSANIEVRVTEANNPIVELLEQTEVRVTETNIPIVELLEQTEVRVTEANRPIMELMEQT